eukprot:Em0091g2a
MVKVSQFATHGLSCRKSAGRHHRHSAVNEIIHRALVSAHVPSRLEPSGLYRSDGKRPDGVSIVPWKCGQLLVWDATCPDTFAPSYSTIAAHQVGAVAQQAEDRKMQKYKHLDSCYFFTPVAIETSGVFGPKTTEFLKELGLRLRQVSGEANSFAYLTQRLSVAIQRGNAAFVLGTIKMDSEEEEFLLFLAATPANRARLLSVASCHASSWLSVIPARGLNLHMDPAEFQVALKWWLGVDTSPYLRCPHCPDHQARLGGQLEVGGGTEADGSRSRPADYLVPNWSTGKPAAFDSTVTSPLNPISLPEAKVTGGSAARMAEMCKHTSNDPKCRALGWVCIPLAVETYGCWG